MQYCTKCPDAVAHITGGLEAPKLSGSVRFYQENSCVLIVARVSGLPSVSKSGFFGFHIHQGESCSGPDLPGTGSHYNPAEQALRNTLATCYHYCAATETPIYLYGRTGFL